MSVINLYNIDCLEFMRNAADKYYDLAIVDPPYGLGEKLRIGGKNGHLKFSGMYEQNDWRDEKPPQEYFDELFRISVNQIIWGGNYFNLPSYRCPIIWDKLQPVENFSQIELAWTSFDMPAKKYTERQAGFIGEKKIHPTQKPSGLYRWLLNKFAKTGDTIFDSHGGSMSIAIACHEMEFDLDLCELDEQYFKDGKERYDQFAKVFRKQEKLELK